MSPAAAGVPYGIDTDDPAEMITLIHPDNETASQKTLRKWLGFVGFKKIQFVEGSIRTATGGARGAVNLSRTVIFIRVDGNTPAIQTAMHEAMHRIISLAKDRELVHNFVQNLLLDNLTDEDYDRLYVAYQVKYKKDVAGLSTRAARDYIEEEIFCDAFANLNSYEVNAGELLHDVVMSHVTEFDDGLYLTHPTVDDEFARLSKEEETQAPEQLTVEEKLARELEKKERRQAAKAAKAAEKAERDAAKPYEQKTPMNQLLYNKDATTPKPVCFPRANDPNASNEWRHAVIRYGLDPDAYLVLPGEHARDLQMTPTEALNFNAKLLDECPYNLAPANETPEQRERRERAQRKWFFNHSIPVRDGVPLHAHGLTAQFLAKLPRLIDDPLMVYNYKDPKNPQNDGISFLLREPVEYLDSQGRLCYLPAIVTLSPGITQICDKESGALIDVRAIVIRTCFGVANGSNKLFWLNNILSKTDRGRGNLLETAEIDDIVRWFDNVAQLPDFTFQVSDDLEAIESFMALKSRYTQMLVEQSKANLYSKEEDYDNYGRKLTPKMAEFMKDSYVREGESLTGALKAVYRGARYGRDNPHNPNTGHSFWTDRAPVARTYKGNYLGEAIPGNRNKANKGLDAYAFASKSARKEAVKVYDKLNDYNLDDEERRKLNARLRELSDESQQYADDIYRLHPDHNVMPKEAPTDPKELILFLRSRRLVDKKLEEIATGKMWQDPKTGELLSYDQLREMANNVIFDIQQGRVLYECYLNMKHPYIVDARGAAYYGLYDQYGSSTDAIVDSIESNHRDEYDGVIFKNIVDTVGTGMLPGDATSTVYVVFQPEQVKSTANYKPTASDPRAAYSKEEDFEDMAPTFYYKAGKVLNDYKGGKISVASLNSYLKGHGVKAEEIKWLGLEAAFEGKKSVSKDEINAYLETNPLAVDVELLSRNTGARVYYDADGTAMGSTEEEVTEYLKENYSAEIQSAIEQAEEDGLDARLFVEVDEDFGVAASVEDIGYTSDGDFGEGVEYWSFRSGPPPRDNTRWREYSTPGGENYREYLYKLPNSQYTNRNMRVHWSKPGVLAHARVQDFVVPGVGKVLFVEEIQSDWHNAGQQEGYQTEELLKLEEEYKTKQRERENLIVDLGTARRGPGELDVADEYAMQSRIAEVDAQIAELDKRLHPETTRYRKEIQAIVEELSNEVLGPILKRHAEYRYQGNAQYARTNLLSTASRAHKEFITSAAPHVTDADYSAEQFVKDVETLRDWGERLASANTEERFARANETDEQRALKAPDAPFKKSYTDFVLKDLLRRAAEGGYDKLAWTSAQMQADRWSYEFMEGYRIEYDQDIPNFLKKYGKQWNADVSTIVLNAPDPTTGVLPEVQAIDITPEMKTVVLEEGQPMFSKDDSVPSNISAKAQEMLNALGRNTNPYDTEKNLAFAFEELPEVRASRRISNDKRNAKKAQQSTELHTPKDEAYRSELLLRFTRGNQSGSWTGKDFSGKVEANKKLIVVLGMPAAGKSSAISEFLSWQHKAYLSDQDRMVELHKDYESGRAADFVRADCRRINLKAEQYAIEQGLNVVIPTVGEDAGHFEHTRLQRFIDAGYDITIGYVDVPKYVALGRALYRFLKGGRLTDAHYMIGTVGDGPRNTFDGLREKWEGVQNANLRATAGEDYKPGDQRSLPNADGEADESLPGLLLGRTERLLGRESSFRDGGQHSTGGPYSGQHMGVLGTAGSEVRSSALIESVTGMFELDNSVPFGQKPVLVWESEPGLSGTEQEREAYQEVLDQAAAELEALKNHPEEHLSGAARDKRNAMKRLWTKDSGIPLSQVTDTGYILSEEDAERLKHSIARVNLDPEAPILTLLSGSKNFGYSQMRREFSDLRRDVTEEDGVPLTGAHYAATNLLTAMTYYRDVPNTDLMLDPNLVAYAEEAKARWQAEKLRMTEARESYLDDYNFEHRTFLRASELDAIDETFREMRKECDGLYYEYVFAQKRAILSSAHIRNSEDPSPIAAHDFQTKEEALEYLISEHRMESADSVYPIPADEFVEQRLGNLLEAEYGALVSYLVGHHLPALVDPATYLTGKNAKQQQLIDSVSVHTERFKKAAKKAARPTPKNRNGTMLKLGYLVDLDTSAKDLRDELNKLSSNDSSVLLQLNLSRLRSVVTDTIDAMQWLWMLNSAAQAEREVLAYYDEVDNTEHFFYNEQAMMQWAKTVAETHGELNGGVYAFMLDLRNPYITDAHGSEWAQLDDPLGHITRDIEVEVEKIGENDGVVFLNVNDNGHYTFVTPEMKPDYLTDVFCFYSDDAVVPLFGRPTLSKETESFEQDILDIIKSGKDEADALQKLTTWLSAAVNGLPGEKQQAKIISGNPLSHLMQDPISPQDRAANRKEIDDLIAKHGALPEGEKKARNVLLPKKTDDDKQVRKHLQTAAEAQNVPDETVPYIERLVLKDEAATYARMTDQAAIAYADEKMSRRGYVKLLQEWDGLASEDHFPTKNDIAVGELLFLEAAAAGDETTALRVLADVAAMGTQAGQTVQAMSLLKKTTPSGQLYYLQKAVDRMNKDLAKKIAKGKLREIIIDPEIAKKVIRAKTKDELDTAMGELLQNIADQAPVSLRDKWNTWRYLAMLGNPRTHFRNMAGNTIFMPVTFLKDLVAAGLESWFLEDSQRTKNAGQLMHTIGSGLTKGKYGSTEFTDFATSDFAEVRDELCNSGKYNPADLIRDKRKIFKSTAFGWVNAASDFNYKALEWEDGLALRPAYVRAMSQFLAARNADMNTLGKTKAGKKLLNEARGYAMNEAQRATYRDFSSVAIALNRLKKVPVLNVLVDGVLPFTKTPVNILKRGIEYSPVGLLDNLIRGSIRLKNGDITAAQYIDGIASGLTGTGIMLIGILMRSLGILKGGDDDDENKSLLDDLMGRQPYSIELGGVSFTIDWMAPMSLPLFVGAEIASQFADGKLTGGELLDAVTLIAEPMFSLSMLDGLNKTIKSAGYDENPLSSVLVSTVLSYFGQAMPTLFGQMSRTIDDDRRATYVDKNSSVPAALQRFWQSTVLSKLPGLSSGRMAYVDEWGRKDTSGSVLLRALENFISPGYFNEIKVTNVEHELTRLSDALGRTDMMPTKAGKYFSVGGERKDLTADEYEQYATERGQTSYKLMRDLVASAGYQALPDEGKAIAVENVYEYATQLAKKTIAPEYKQDTWVVNTGATGTDPAEMAILRAVEKVNTDAGVENSTVGNIVSMNWLSDDERGALLSSAYYADTSFTDPNRSGYEYSLSAEQQAREKELYFEEFNERYEKLISGTRFENADEERRAELISDLQSDARAATRKALAKELRQSGTKSTKK